MFENIQEIINELHRMKKEYNAPQGCCVRTQERNGYRSKCLSIAIKALSEVQTLAKAKADGRLVVLPCKVGDTAYEIVDSVDIPYVRQEKVIAIELWNKNGAMTMFIRTPYGLFEFDKTVFLTREAAEKALERGGNNGCGKKNKA